MEVSPHRIFGNFRIFRDALHRWWALVYSTDHIGQTMRIPLDTRSNPQGEGDAFGSGPLLFINGAISALLSDVGPPLPRANGLDDDDAEPDDPCPTFLLIGVVQQKLLWTEPLAYHIQLQLEEERAWDVW